MEAGRRLVGGYLARAASGTRAECVLRKRARTDKTRGEMGIIQVDKTSGKVEFGEIDRRGLRGMGKGGKTDAETKHDKVRVQIGWSKGSTPQQTQYFTV